MGELLEWVISELSSLLQFPVTEDMAQCIIQIESNRDLEEYLLTLLDMTNSSSQKFMKELMQKKQASFESAGQGYKKTQLDNYIQNRTQEKKKKGKGKADGKKECNEEISPQEKKKNKYVSIYSSDCPSENVLFKGRHECICQATKHNLVNNCLKCGRIVCEQEGVGPCFFCENYVGGRNEIVNGRQMSKNSSAAVELKDRLLEYDRTSEKRTRVIDDESDYFTTNSVWLTKEQKEELKKKEEELQAAKHSRHSNKLLLDFTGRCVIHDEYAGLADLEDSLVEEVASLLVDSGPVSSQNAERGDLDPNSTSTLQPIYCGGEGGGLEMKGSRWHNHLGRVQDKQVMEMSDAGVCLSLHQPYATLLVSGIKRHEGRSWYTSHRGRLWIAATAKVPTPEETEEVLAYYSALRGDEKLPKKYPSGCLLGCVTVSDCLAQEEYREKYPDGESDAPFVFICEDPIPSPIMFPIKGQHKIYKLDGKIHQAAVKCIQKMAKVK